MFHNDDWQFYSTSKSLGARAWAKFRMRHERMLEPSAGDGALIKAHPHWGKRHYYTPVIDAIEIDVTKHEALRACGVDVVGLDFMTFGSAAMYSGILLNPPFKYGVQHVLKAWQILWDGEIVAILNAESLRNPFSQERQLLLNLIEQHGDVEFIPDAFQGEDVVRKADVEIALVYLRKQANIEEDIFADLLTNLKEDRETGEGLAGEYDRPQDLTLPRTEIETRVATFEAAVKTMQAAVFAEAKARYYTSLLGQTMAEHIDQKAAKCGETSKWIQDQIAERYGKLKDAAWAGILRSSNVTSKLSSKAQTRVESEFESIKKLQFDCQTVYGFLTGIVESQGQIQIDMLCDIFDRITEHHMDNTCFYKSYKSNAKHRTCGMKIKSTRFIIPRIGAWRDSLDWDAMQMLRDFDKVFALLDGKREPEISLESLFATRYSELRNGARLQGSYLDVRFYPGARTIHFFPNKKLNLVDRLNRLVGRQRQWIPPRDEDVTQNFWQAYDKAEKLNEALQKAMVKSSQRYYGCSPFAALFFKDAADRDAAAARIVPIIENVLEENGISPQFQAIERKDPEQLLLAA